MPKLAPTKEQGDVLDHGGPLVAIAKPGSGKTFVLSELIKQVLPSYSDHQGVIAISFTNKASDELKKRSNGGGVDVKSSFFGTIDKFCGGEIIIPFGAHLWGQPDATISITKIGELPEDEQSLFSDIQANAVSLEQIEPHLSMLRAYFKKGIVFLETLGALALYVLENSVACQRYLRVRYTHIIVDEYQDSGLEQHALFLKLHSMGLIAVAVGDPDQSIFAFSNKDPKYLLSLVKRPEFQTFPITKNHRSHPSIINYSLRFLDEGADLLDADKIRVYHKRCVGNISAICSWIDTIIPVLVKKYSIDALGKVGILVPYSRTGETVNTVLKLKHHYFETHPIENHLSLWSGLFSSLLRFRYNTTFAAQDVIDGYWGDASTSELKRIRKLIKPVRTLDEDMLYDYLLHLAVTLLPNAHSTSAGELLKDVLDRGSHKYFKTVDEDEIQIMTLHKSKGLEFDIVFNLDLHEWVFPAKIPGDNNDFDNPIYPNGEQDVNLHYVGITRARKLCVLCTSTQRTNRQGQVKQARSSEFLLRHDLSSLRKVVNK
tara:strand:+ start:2125 stop:3756 length:1632 start_codon:yes stop_codon:yes gene_type:complete